MPIEELVVGKADLGTSGGWLHAGAEYVQWDVLAKAFTSDFTCADGGDVLARRSSVGGVILSCILLYGVFLGENSVHV